MQSVSGSPTSSPFVIEPPTPPAVSGRGQDIPAADMEKTMSQITAGEFMLVTRQGAHIFHHSLVYMSTQIIVV